MNPSTPSKESDLKIITLNLNHLKLCEDLDKITLNGIWDQKSWEKELTDSSRISIGIINSYKLIGLACGWVILNEFHLTAIAVHPAYRKKGVARSILKELLNRAKSKGSNQATLEVDIKNYPAINLYKFFGFKTTGLRRKYCKNGNDALIKTLDMR